MITSDFYAAQFHEADVHAAERELDRRLRLELATEGDRPASGAGRRRLLRLPRLVLR